MAQSIVLVCDECGRPDATSITIRAGEKNYVKDLCGEHLAALLKDTRAPRRGRPRTTAGASASSTAGPAGGRKRRATRKTSGARKASGSQKRTASSSRSKPAQASRGTGKRRAAKATKAAARGGRTKTAARSG